MNAVIEVQDLITRYSDAINRRDWEVVKSVFAPDGTWESLGPPVFAFAGPDVGPGIRSLVEPARFFVQMNSPALIEINGDRATARSTIFEKGEYPPGAIAAFDGRFESFGIYSDVLHLRTDGWRFTKRTFSFLSMTVDPTPASTSNT